GKQLKELKDLSKTTTIQYHVRHPVFPWIKQTKKIVGALFQLIQKYRRQPCLISSNPAQHNVSYAESGTDSGNLHMKIAFRERFLFQSWCWIIGETRQ
ncbi:MAG TPA: hypothetical protein PKV06_11505, partial [bacterium]|nr:hypothetical protein [bacterium]HND44261.1 hypothetical protein [Cyclobacteriaceae bacterium]